MSNILKEKVEQLSKALEAGSYNAAPGSLTQGSSLQMEDLSEIMNVATFDDSKIKLQKSLKIKKAKGTLIQFNRQLDYGVFGGSATLEGGVGQEETDTYVRAVVPMAYYVHVRRVTVQAEMIEAFDGVKAEDRVEASAALKLAGDMEFELFRGKSAYSNAGVFDGNPLAMAQNEAGMHGLDPQIRQSDYDYATKDLMFDEYGADTSVAINQNGVLSQSTIEDIYSRAQMNHGSPEKLFIDPLTHGAYNKISHNKERIVLAGSPQAATGASLNNQWVAGGAISIESSRFLSGKTKPSRVRIGAPSAPSIASAIVSASGTSFMAAEVYKYSVTAVGDMGEGAESAVNTATIVANGDSVSLTITPAGGIAPRSFNVYRSKANETKREFIGRVVAQGASAVVFTDLNNRNPGFVTGFALDMRGMELAELSSFKSMDLAQVDLTKPKAFLRFAALVVKLPRFNLLIDNLSK